jgi:hypothetical protein
MNQKFDNAQDEKDYELTKIVPEKFIDWPSDVEEVSDALD